jgi:hypothetical protein
LPPTGWVFTRTVTGWPNWWETVPPSLVVTTSSPCLEVRLNGFGWWLHRRFSWVSYYLYDMTKIKFPRTPSPDPLIEDLIQLLQSQGCVADTLNNIDRFSGSSSTRRPTSLNQCPLGQPTSTQTRPDWRTIDQKRVVVCSPVSALLNVSGTV